MTVAQTSSFFVATSLGIGLLGCASSAPKPAADRPSLGGVEKSTCQDGLVACLRARVATCEGAPISLAGTLAGNISFAAKVAAPSFAVVDILGGRFFTQDGENWLACFPGCDAAAPQATTCFPAPPPPVLETPAIRNCRAENSTATTYLSHSANQVTAACETGSLERVVVASFLKPSLLLSQLGVVADETGLSHDGLVAKQSAGKNVLWEMTTLEEMSCQDMAAQLPGPGTVFDTTSNVAWVHENWPTLQERSTNAMQPLLQNAYDTAVTAAQKSTLELVRAQYADTCRKNGYDTSDAKIEACAGTIPQAEKHFETTLASLMLSANETLAPQVHEILRNQTYLPLCQQFLASAPKTQP